MEISRTHVQEELAHTLSKALMRICYNNAKSEMERKIKKFVCVLRKKETSKYLQMLIKSKLPHINNSKIKLDCNITKTSNSDTIVNDDIENLVGNLLDNAIEACKKIENQNSRWIKIHIYEEEDKFLFIDIFNSKNCSYGDFENRDGEIKEKMGRGFKHLETFLKKYEGDLASFGGYGDRFSVEIQIPIHTQMTEMTFYEAKKYMFKGIPLCNYIDY